MKLRKIFALLMTLVMMLGMMPTAGASSFWCPDEGLSHSWGPTEWPRGTCSVGLRWCTRCGAGEDVNPQHKWQNVVQESPDCFEPGWEESMCSECGDEKGDGHEIPALGHNWYTRVNEQPTCTEEGWQEIICSRCGSEQGNPQRIPPLGHNWSGWKVTQKPSCKEEGKEVSSCSRCGISESRNIPALGHDWTAWYTENEPTCTERGTTRMDCERCGTYSFNYLEPTGHAFGDWHVTVEPKPGIPGEEQRECSKCGLIETRELTALEGEMDISGPTLTLSLSSTPANGSHFVVGEEVTFT